MTVLISKQVKAGSQKNNSLPDYVFRDESSMLKKLKKAELNFEKNLSSRKAKQVLSDLQNKINSFS